MLPAFAHSAVDSAVESLCNEGCKAVHGYIEQLEQNHPIALLNGLTDREKQQVLAELRSIMAVYDRCQCQ
ncbi:MAG: hypothetical protein OEZ39_19675 [Gammaproteobacteria bacterium]|nr:hypothetical protein [Gammaproteobacteria bacterium]MDH5654087.1 hypothetical protein [Gammaproteobacteria bacterium]